MTERRLIVLPEPAAAAEFARVLAAQRPTGGCALHGELVPGLTAALGAQWALVDVQLRELVADTTHAIWLSSLRLHHFGDVEVRVAAPPAISSWVRDRFGRVLERAVAQAAGGPRRVVVECCEHCTPSTNGRVS